jgi:hypothetical protein
MRALSTHRYIDLGIAVGVVSASIATGQMMTAEGHQDLVNTFVLFNDLVDFRGTRGATRGRMLSFVESEDAFART